MVTDSASLDNAVRWLRQTPLAAVEVALLSRFGDRGYAQSTAARYVRSIAHLGEWFAARQLSLADLSAPLLVQFVDDHLPRCRCRARIERDRKSVRAALGQLAIVLDSDGQRLTRQRRDDFPLAIGRSLNALDAHLQQARGASLATRTYCRRYVGYFLVWRFGTGAVIPADLCADDLRCFLVERSRACTPGTVGVIATALRTYLRYLVFCGYPAAGLIASVPAVARWRKASLPQHLTVAQEKCLLASVDRSCPTGRRDYAMLLTMCQLGLRVSEVAGLRLDDIDWRNGTIALHVAKSRRVQQLPLLGTLGTAIVAYLRSGRPSSGDRHLFLRHRPPRGRAVSTELIRGVVRRTYQRAGLPATWTGTHRLRHTAAARMVQGRASIKQIADVLGHRSIDTTALYAKVDLEALRTVALPWPGRVRS